jgi:hypothetical protein
MPSTDYTFFKDIDGQWKIRGPNGLIVSQKKAKEVGGKRAMGRDAHKMEVMETWKKLNARG